MNNERLEQIRDSVDFQLSAEKNLKIDKQVILEEKELLDEIDRLKALNKEYVYELGLNEFEHTTIIDTTYKDESKYWENEWNSLYKVYYDFKIRIDKAIEYINKTNTFQIIHFADDFLEELRKKTKNDLLNILEGNNER